MVRPSAGSRADSSGILDIQGPGRDQTRDFDTTVDGRAVVREESSFEDIDVSEHLDEIEAIAAGERVDPYDLLVQSINLEHKGDEDVKLATPLQMFGGGPAADRSGATRTFS